MGGYLKRPCVDLGIHGIVNLPNSAQREEKVRLARPWSMPKLLPALSYDDDNILVFVCSPSPVLFSFLHAILLRDSRLSYPQAAAADCDSVGTIRCIWSQIPELISHFHLSDFFPCVDAGSVRGPSPSRRTGDGFITSRVTSQWRQYFYRHRTLSLNARLVHRRTQLLQQQ